MSIPFAFATGALIGGKTQDEWVDPGRAWGHHNLGAAGQRAVAGVLVGLLPSWAGAGSGSGPGGDAAFMPWLALTAFVHSVMVQKRRGMFRSWNIVLINVAFALALYGMFMNRGGPVPSVHSFGASSLGWVFLLFLAVGVVVPFAIFFWRYNLLRSARTWTRCSPERRSSWSITCCCWVLPSSPCGAPSIPSSPGWAPGRNNDSPAILRPGQWSSAIGPVVPHGRRPSGSLETRHPGQPETGVVVARVCGCVGGSPASGPGNADSPMRWLALG